MSRLRKLSTNITPPRRERRRRIGAGIVAALLAVGLALGVYARHLGYPSGPIWRAYTAAGAAPRNGTVAVFMSGDMGLNTGMAVGITDRLARAGMPVIGVNSLAAFAYRRTPAEIDALVREATARALAVPGARRVVLIGQSFGANALLAGVGALPAAWRARVALVALVVPGQTMLRRATPGGAFDIGDDGPALPAARRLDWVPVLCVSGAEEDDSLCPGWKQPNVTRAVLPGDHYLHHDAALVTATLLRRLARPAPALA